MYCSGPIGPSDRSTIAAHSDLDHREVLAMTSTRNGIVGKFPGFIWLRPALVLALMAWGSYLIACPFCSAVKQTLRQEMETMDAVAIGQLVIDPTAKSNEIDGEAKFTILKVLKGDKLIAAGQVIQATYFGAASSDKKFLLLGVDPAQLLWSSPLPLSPEAQAYVEAIPGLPSDSVERLKFYLKHLEHPDSLLARDAYDEFAITPYEEVKQLKPLMNREQLLEWIQDDSLSPDRKRLYLTLLGVCGKEEDTDVLEERMRSEDGEKKAGLDAMIACYLTLKGNAGLPLVEELFLKNKNSPYADTYSAIMALRFHGTEGGVLDRKNIVTSMHHILERPELADLVIPDLARWEDWTPMDRLVQLFKEANEESSWVRVPVINYLRACPLPEAAKKLEELEKIDPKAVQRAKTFFPIPQPTPATNDSSRVEPVAAPDVVAASFSQPAPTNKSDNLSAAALVPVENRVAANLPLPSGLSLQETSEIPPVNDPRNAGVNRLFLGSVGAISVAILAMTMWLVISGTGVSKPSPVPMQDR
jgi:hypothetical protein